MTSAVCSYMQPYTDHKHTHMNMIMKKQIIAPHEERASGIIHPPLNPLKTSKEAERRSQVLLQSSELWYCVLPCQPAADSQTDIQVFELSNLHPNQWCNYTSGNIAIGLSFLGPSDFREKEVGHVLISTMQTHSRGSEGLHFLHLQASQPRTLTSSSEVQPMRTDHAEASCCQHLGHHTEQEHLRKII